MTRKLLFAAFLVTLALTVIAAHHQLTNAAPNMAPPPKNAPPLEIYAERFQMSASQVASAAQLQASAAYTTPMVGGWYKVTGGNGLQQTIRAIDMISPTEGWAVGDYGLLLHYTNGAWATNTISNPQPYYNFGNLDMLKSVSMVNAGDGWAVGDPCYTWSSFGSCVIDANNVVLRYDGQRWTRFLTVTTNVPSGTGLELMVVQMLSSTEGWAVGNDILHFDGTS